MVQKKYVFYVLSGNAPDWPPCDVGVIIGGGDSNVFLPETLIVKDAFVLKDQ